MKINDTQTGTERSETRTEILARHNLMVSNNRAGATLLEEIKRECFDTEAIELDARLEWNEYQQDRADLGLVSLINKSKELMPVADIVERCSALLARHNGFKGGVHRLEDKPGFRKQLKELQGMEVEEETEETAE